MSTPSEDISEVETAAKAGKINRKEYDGKETSRQEEDNKIRNTVQTDKNGIPKRRAYAGGFVLYPIQGFQEEIFCLSFGSLYPSINGIYPSINF